MSASLRARTGNEPASELAVFIEPITRHFRADRLFAPLGIAGSYHEPYLAVREALGARSIPVHTADLLLSGERGAALNLYFSMGNLENYRQLARRDDVVLSGLFHIEAPIIHPSTYRRTADASKVFRRIFSFSTPEALSEFGCAGLTFQRYCIPEPYDGVLPQLWANRDRRFLTIISQNKRPPLANNELYTERLRVIEHFARTGSIDLYGLGWDGPPFRVGEHGVPARLLRVQRAVRKRLPNRGNGVWDDLIRSVYKGPVKSKHETMAGYTFAVCYENMVLEGWINEKIFDAFVVGTIPIFRGAPDVAKLIPATAFIDPREFSSYEELERFLRSLDKRAIDDYRESARAFMTSESYRPFSKQAFAEHFERAVLEDLASRR